MSKLKKIYHIADVHIRNVKRHNEYRQVFEKMFEEIRKRGTEDSIIYLAGDIAHAKLELSPELVREISWLFTECSKHCETILITGNHDCNMNNSDRLDVLTQMSPFVGTFFSKKYVLKKVLRLSDDEILEMEQDIEAEPAPQMPPINNGSQQ